ncbi:MAG: hypothetical protein PHP00_10215 [Thiotrichaceae bacterium]|nr:hypothetical protein [Thiotrichaceae bacterium]
MNSELVKKAFNTNNILLFIILSGTFIFGYKQQAAEMGLFIVAGAISLAFANISKIQRFKGAGFEAEMRELKHEVQQTVDDANITINNLKEMAKPLIISSLIQLNYAGRFAGMTDAVKKQELRDDLEKLANTLKLSSDTDIQKVFKEYLSSTAWDHLGRIGEKLGFEKSKSIELLNLPLDEFVSKSVTSKEIRDALSGSEFDDIREEIEPLIEDYEYYLKEHKFRRPELWK